MKGKFLTFTLQTLSQLSIDFLALLNAGGSHFYSKFLQRVGDLKKDQTSYVIIKTETLSNLL